mgnify:CR=1 FL=1
MEVVIGKDADAVTFVFKLSNHTEGLDELKKIDQEKDQLEKIRLMNGVVTNRIVSVKNLFDVDENGKEYEVTAEHIKKGQIPTYFLTLITKAFRAENSGLNEKNELTSV